MGLTLGLDSQTLWNKEYNLNFDTEKFKKNIEADKVTRSVTMPEVVSRVYGMMLQTINASHHPGVGVVPPTLTFHL